MRRRCVGGFQSSYSLLGSANCAGSCIGKRAGLPHAEKRTDRPDVRHRTYLLSAVRGRRRALTLGSRRMTCSSICLDVLSRTRRGGAGCAARRADTPVSGISLPDPVNSGVARCAFASRGLVAARKRARKPSPAGSAAEVRNALPVARVASFRLMATRRQATASRHLGPGKGTWRGAQGSIIRGCRSPHASSRWIP